MACRTGRSCLVDKTAEAWITVVEHQLKWRSIIHMHVRSRMRTVVFSFLRMSAMRSSPKQLVFGLNIFSLLQHIGIFCVKFGISRLLLEILRILWELSSTRIVLKSTGFIVFILVVWCVVERPWFSYTDYLASNGVIHQCSGNVQGTGRID